MRAPAHETVLALALCGQLRGQRQRVRHRVLPIRHRHLFRADDGLRVGRRGALVGPQIADAAVAAGVAGADGNGMGPLALDGLGGDDGGGEDRRRVAEDHGNGRVEPDLVPVGLRHGVIEEPAQQHLVFRLRRGHGLKLLQMLDDLAGEQLPLGVLEAVFRPGDHRVALVVDDGIDGKAVGGKADRPARLRRLRAGRHHLAHVGPVGEVDHAELRAVRVRQFDAHFHAMPGGGLKLVPLRVHQFDVKEAHILRLPRRHAQGVLAGGHIACIGRAVRGQFRCLQRRVLRQSGVGGIGDADAVVVAVGGQHRGLQGDAHQGEGGLLVDLEADAGPVAFFLLHREVLRQLPQGIRGLRGRRFLRLLVRVVGTVQPGRPLRRVRVRGGRLRVRAPIRGFHRSSFFHIRERIFGLRVPVGRFRRDRLFRRLRFTLPRFRQLPVVRGQPQRDGGNTRRVGQRQPSAKEGLRQRPKAPEDAQAPPLRGAQDPGPGALGQGVHQASVPGGGLVRRCPGRQRGQRVPAARPDALDGLGLPGLRQLHHHRLLIGGDQGRADRDPEGQPGLHRLSGPEVVERQADGLNDPAVRLLHRVQYPRLLPRLERHAAQAQIRPHGKGTVRNLDRHRHRVRALAHRPGDGMPGHRCGQRLGDGAQFRDQQEHRAEDHKKFLKQIGFDGLISHFCPPNCTDFCLFSQFF